MARDQRGGRTAGNVNWGICTNTSGYEKDGEQRKCSKCMNKEKQAIRASKDFVCEECGERLTKCPPPKKKLPWPIIIAAAVVVIGGSIGVYLGIKSSNEKKKEAARLEALRIEDSIRQVREAEEQRMAALEAAAIDSARAAFIADSLEQVRIADSLEQVRIADSIAKAKKKTTPTTGGGSGSSNLGWGSYSGPMQGGKPHGIGGTIKVKSNYSIDLKDGRGSKLDVRPGETIENTKFENGRLRAGELHRNDGTRKWFNC